MNRLQIRTAIKTTLDDLIGGDSDQYWSADTVNEYIQEAMEEIAKRTLCIKDSLTPAFCYIDVEPNVIHYQFPDRVLEIESVDKSWDGMPLTKTDHADITVANRLWQTTTVEPVKYLTDFSKGYLSIVGRLTSVVDEQFRMSVRRLPVIMTDDEDIPEVPYQYHVMSYDWVFYRCFSKQDSEIVSRTLAKDYLQRFEGPQSQLGKGGNIQQILLQDRPFCTKTKVRFS